jgi:hypothetical protein
MATATRGKQPHAEVGADGKPIVMAGFGSVRIECTASAGLGVEPAGTRIGLPKFRDAAGVLRSAIILPGRNRRPDRRRGARRADRARHRKAPVHRTDARSMTPVFRTGVTSSRKLGYYGANPYEVGKSTISFDFH